MKIDGFYGKQPLLKKNIVLVGTGVGITPLLSMAWDICHRQAGHVTLLWSVRHVDEFLAFAPSLVAAMDKYGQMLRVKVWLTGGGEDVPTQTRNKLRTIRARTRSSVDEVAVLPMMHVADSPVFKALLAMLVGVAAFAWSESLQQEDGEYHNIPDVVNLVNLLMVTASIAGCALACHLLLDLLRCESLQQKDVKCDKASSSEYAAEIDGISQIQISDLPNPTKIVGDFYAEIEEKLADNENHFDSILTGLVDGRVGSGRPRLQDEFTEIASKMVSKTEISVVGCGSRQMINIVMDVGAKKMIAAPTPTVQIVKHIIR